MRSVDFFFSELMVIITSCELNRLFLQSKIHYSKYVKTFRLKELKIIMIYHETLFLQEQSCNQQCVKYVQSEQ